MRLLTVLAWVLLVALTAPARAQDDDQNDQNEGDTQLMTGCSWKDVTLEFPAAPFGKLSFRYQDCDETNGTKVGYSLDKVGVLTQTLNKYSDSAARFWPLDGKRPSALIETLASPSIAPEEKGRCVVHLDIITGNYAYTPNARYLEELLDQDEPFGACGEYGDSNDSMQYWIVIDNTLLAYLWLGQDTPIYDPKSFKYTPAK